MADSDIQSFTHVAPWYDAIMAGVPYEQWVRYIEEILDKFGEKPDTVLDLACGTGRVSRLLYKKGYRVVGVDGSSAMIEEAKARTSKSQVEYVCQRMEQLDLNRRFDLVLSLFDSLNYIIEPDDLQECYRRVADHMEPGGLFIFDLNGLYAYEADMFTQDSYGPRRSVEYSWRSSFDREKGLCHVYMNYRVKEGGRRREFKEVHVQRAYTVEEINAMLATAGLEILAVYDGYTLEPVRPKSDRIFWVAQRPLESSTP